MTTQVPGYVSKTDMVAALIREGLRRRRELNEQMRALAEGDAGAASARTYQHIMGADPVKEVSG
jgi:hypothetical protein